MWQKIAAECGQNISRAKLTTAVWVLLKPQQSKIVLMKLSLTKLRKKIFACSEFA